jgi:hypothetical protein
VSDVEVDVEIEFFGGDGSAKLFESGSGRLAAL